MTKDSALHMALEALERGETELRWKAITAIKEALAQPEQEQLMSDQINYGMSVTQGGKRIDPMSIYKEPEQEPVAWIYSQGAAKVVSMNYVAGVRASPLYTTPPQRTWVGLTEDEAFACKGRDYFETYKAIEAKLKEKNT